MFGTILQTWSLTFFIQRLQTFFLYSCHVFNAFFIVMWTFFLHIWCHDWWVSGMYITDRDAPLQYLLMMMKFVVVYWSYIVHYVYISWANKHRCCSSCYWYTDVPLQYLLMLMKFAVLVTVITLVYSSEVTHYISYYTYRILLLYIFLMYT